MRDRSPVKWVERSEARIDGRHPGTARPFPLRRLRKRPVAAHRSIRARRIAAPPPPPARPTSRRVTRFRPHCRCDLHRRALWRVCHIPLDKLRARFDNLPMHSCEQVHRMRTPIRGTSAIRSNISSSRDGNPWTPFEDLQEPLQTKRWSSQVPLRRWSSSTARFTTTS